MSDGDQIQIPQFHPQLGRNVLHDPASRAFPIARRAVDRSSWTDMAIRIYDPLPNPNQCHGECTGCAKMMQFNAIGNRRSRTVFGMHEAHINYASNTTRDPWPGTFTYNRATRETGGVDTGSSGLASCKSAVAEGIGGAYFHEFGGIEGVLQNIHERRVMSTGTLWYWDMFEASGGTHNGYPIVKPTGGQAGGHQYVLRGHDVDRKLVLGRCWWNGFRDFWMHEDGADDLIRDRGDSHWQEIKR